MIIAPDLILYRTVESILSLIRVDWNNNSLDRTQSLLYRLLFGTAYGQYDLYKEAQTVFLCQLDDPRLIQVKMSFDSERKGFPTIYVNLPGEESINNGLGTDEGFGTPIFVDKVVDEEVVSTKMTTQMTRRFDSTYALVICSENRNEVVMIYHLLKALLIPVIVHLEMQGLQNGKISGKDLQINSETLPTHLFMRTIGINFSYDETVPNYVSKQILSSILFSGSIQI